MTATTMGTMLVQKIKGEERAICNINKKFNEYETRYTTLEKTTLSLV